jgi:hypothetical protein
VSFSKKAWKNSPNVTTPISAGALEDLEKRLSDYTDTGDSTKLAKTEKGAAGEAGKVLAADDPLLSSVVSGSGKWFMGETVSEIEEQAAALLAPGTPYTYTVVSGGALLDFGGGTT